MRFIIVLAALGLLLAPAAVLLAQSRTPPVENEFVRVVMATDQPVAKPGPLHEHKQNRVMIYLDSGDIQIQYADGRVDDQHWKAGDIAWSPAGGMHTSQNVSSIPMRIVEVELRNLELGNLGLRKQGKTASKPNPAAALDNSQVLVYRATVPPASKNFLAVSEKANTVAWKSLPDGPGPYIFIEVK
jgi:mannose-6-phosphate isomerase-like protein (cupin superfamily)